MYLYFLPLADAATAAAVPSASEAMIANPTPDGGLEHTAARFLPPAEWLRMCRAGEIMLFPPQFFLLHLLAPFLSAEHADTAPDASELASQRERLMGFVKGGAVPWTEKCISPTFLLRTEGDGRSVLALDKPGPELEGSARVGEEERVVLVEFGKEGPRDLEVAWRKDVFRQQRLAKQKL
jgi:hypothetical protein